MIEVREKRTYEKGAYLKVLKACLKPATVSSLTQVLGYCASNYIKIALDKGHIEKFVPKSSRYVIYSKMYQLTPAGANYFLETKKEKTETVK